MHRLWVIRVAILDENKNQDHIVMRHTAHFVTSTVCVLFLQLKCAIHQPLSPHDTLPPPPLSFFSGEFKGVMSLGLNAPLEMSLLSNVFSQTERLMKTVHAAAVDHRESGACANQLVSLLRYHVFLAPLMESLPCVDAQGFLLYPVNSLVCRIEIRPNNRQAKTYSWNNGCFVNKIIFIEQYKHKTIFRCSKMWP